MNNFIYIAAALVIGMFVSLQPPINSYVAKSLGSPLLAALISITTTLIVISTLWILLAKGSGEISQIKSLPWWGFLGGIVGVIFVAGSIYVAPNTGIALFFVCAVAGQLFGASVIDQLGAFGLPVKPMNTIKLLGLLLVLAGAILVQSSNTAA